VTNVALRGLLVVGAVLVLAWLAFGVRAVRLEDQAAAVLERARAGEVSDAEVKQATDRLMEARELSPDQGPMLKYGQLLEAVGHQQAAVVAAGAVTVEEPENVEAWFLMWISSQDRETKLKAKRRLLELNPWFSAVLLRARLARQ
jgi:hypothetical protein